MKKTETLRYNASQFPIMAELEKKDPNRNVCFTAIETLKTAYDIREFKQEYVNFLATCGATEEVRQNALEVARQNIGYILGYYDETQHALWFGTLEDVDHPIFGHGFGRGDNPTPEEAFNMGKKLGEKVRKSKE